MTSACLRGAEAPRVESAPIGQWTVDTLKEFLSQQMAQNDRRYLELFEQKAASGRQVIEAQREAVNAALAAADRAVQKAEAGAEKRFESVNEFRNTLSDQQRNLIPRSEVMVIVASLTDKIESTTKQLDALVAERRGVQGGWGYAVGACGFILTLAAVAFRKTGK
jgi:hypothetical protein